MSDKPPRELDITDYEDLAVIIANIVYGYQGSDKAIQSKQVGKKQAGKAFQEMIDGFQPMMKEPNN